MKSILIDIYLPMDAPQNKTIDLDFKIWTHDLSLGGRIFDSARDPLNAALGAIIKGLGQTLGKAPWLQQKVSK